jgi:hypothetical protein
MLDPSIKMDASKVKKRAFVARPWRAVNAP